ncbi:MAG TPA: LicD family protein [Lachnospiraceae bacterium]|nr:LicD family protein [Lachnospiraceae bacterium]
MYNEEVTGNLRKLQLIELNIIHVFQKICTEEKLRYFMIGGTMLGAIRHKGFIPWDDDVDFGMPREDYDRLITLLTDGKRLPENYGFLNYKTSADYLRYFSRIVDKRVLVYNDSGNEEITEQAWIDIFPLDGMPNIPAVRFLHYTDLMATRMRFHLSCFDKMVNMNRPGRPLYQNLIIGFTKKTHLGTKADSKKILDGIDRKLKRYKWRGSTTAANVFGAYAYKEIVSKDIWGSKPCFYQFEDTMLPGPKKFDAFLSNFYGAYLIPPSEDHKDKHNIRKIEFLQTPGDSPKGCDAAGTVPKEETAQ